MDLVDSDIDSCSTVSFRNEDLILEFQLNSVIENKSDGNMSKSVSDKIKIDNYLSEDDDNENEVGNVEEIDEYDGEVKYLSRRHDPSLLTARQRSLMDRKIGNEPENIEEELPTVIQHKRPVNRYQNTEQRRVIKERQRAEQQATIERLLRIHTPTINNSNCLNSNNGQNPSNNSKDLPQPSLNTKVIRIDSQIDSGTTVTYFPREIFRPIGEISTGLYQNKNSVPPLQLCCVPGCNKPRSYACSKTGQSLCYQMQCYKTHLANFTVSK